MRLIDDKGEQFLDTQNDAGDLRVNEYMGAPPSLSPTMPQTTCACCAGSSGDLLTPSPPAEKASACHDQARQTGTNDGTGDGG